MTDLQQHKKASAPKASTLTRGSVPPLLQLAAKLATLTHSASSGQGRPPKLIDLSVDVAEHDAVTAEQQPVRKAGTVIAKAVAPSCSATSHMSNSASTPPNTPQTTTLQEVGVAYLPVTGHSRPPLPPVYKSKYWIVLVLEPLTDHLTHEVALVCQHNQQHWHATNESVLGRDAALLQCHLKATYSMLSQRTVVLLAFRFDTAVVSSVFQFCFLPTFNLLTDLWAPTYCPHIVDLRQPVYSD